MGNIPIENVPNAPKTGAMGLAGANYRTHPLAGVTRGKTPSFASAIRSVGPVLHPYLGSIAKQQAAAGRNLGSAIGQVGGMLGDINQRMLRAENAADEARVDNILTSARQTFAENKVGTDPNTWGEQWGEVAKGVEDQVAGLGLSGYMEDKTKRDLIAFNGSQEVSIRAEQFTTRIAENTAEMGLSAENDFDGGDWDRFEVKMKEMDKLGYLSPGELEPMLKERRKEFVERELINRAVNDPTTVLMELEMRNAESGKLLQHTELDASERLKLENKIKTFENEKTANELQNILRMDDESPDQVGQSLSALDTLWDTGKLTRGELNYWKQQLTLNAPLDTERYNEVHDSIMAMDFEGDTRDNRGEGYRELTARIAGFPKDDRSYLIGLLNGQASRAGKRDKISEAWNDAGDALKRYKEYRKFGDARIEKRDEAGNIIPDPTTGEPSYQKEIDPVRNEKIEEDYRAAQRWLRDQALKKSDMPWPEVKKELQDYMSKYNRGETAELIQPRGVRPLAIKAKETELNSLLKERLSKDLKKAIPTTDELDGSGVIDYIGAEQGGTVGYGVQNGDAMGTRKTEQVGVKGNFSMVTVSHVKKHLGGNLADHAQAFIDAGKEYGIDPRFLASISKLETGNGTSPAFLRGNNAMGISTRKGPRYDFKTVRDSIFQQARSLTRDGGYYEGAASIQAIGDIYAPSGAENDFRGTNHSWANNVKKFYDEMVGSSKAITTLTQFDVSGMTWPEVSGEYYNRKPDGMSSEQAFTDLAELRARWENEKTF